LGWLGKGFQPVHGVIHGGERAACPLDRASSTWIENAGCIIRRNWSRVAVSVDSGRNMGDCAEDLPSAPGAANDRYQAFLQMHLEYKKDLKAACSQDSDRETFLKALSQQAAETGGETDLSDDVLALSAKLDILLTTRSRSAESCEDVELSNANSLSGAHADTAQLALVEEPRNELHRHLEPFSQGLEPFLQGQEAATVGSLNDLPPIPAIPPPRPPLDTSESDSAFKRDLQYFTDVLREALAEQDQTSGGSHAVAPPVVIKEVDSRCNSPLAIACQSGRRSPLALRALDVQPNEAEAHVTDRRKSTEDKLDALEMCQTELADVRRFLRLYRTGTLGPDAGIRGLELDAFAARAQIRRQRLLVHIPRLELSIERARREEDKLRGADSPISKERFVMRPGQAVRRGTAKPPAVVRLLRALGCGCVLGRGWASGEQDLDRSRAANVSDAVSPFLQVGRQNSDLGSVV